MSPRTCVFCRRGPTNREHIWPAWFTRITPPTKLRATGSTAGIERGRWVTNKVDLTVNRFCKNCNSTWMSAIVSEASPLLKRMIAKKSVSLTSEDQAVLARAAYLTALSADFALREDGTKPIPQAAYDSFYEHRDPPPHSHIWTAAYEGSHHWASISRLGLISEDTSPGLVSEEGPPHEFHLTTYIMARAIFHSTLSNTTPVELKAPSS